MGAGIHDEKESSEEKIVRLEKHNEEYYPENKKLQSFLDWAGQPAIIGKLSLEESERHENLSSGYWKAIAKREQSSRPIINQHLHIHSETDLADQYMEQKIRELATRKRPALDGKYKQH